MIILVEVDEVPEALNQTKLSYFHFPVYGEYGVRFISLVQLLFLPNRTASV